MTTPLARLSALTLLGLGALGSAPAAACPAIANGLPEPLGFDTAQVALVRQGDLTTFTVSINPQGTPQDFSLILPVPALLAEGDIAVLDSEIFARLSGTTGVLRMPDAGCSPPERSGGGDADGGGDGGGDGTPSGTVTVEAEYLVGDYAITMLSATESSALFTWLTDHGYQVAPAVLPALEDYIAEGMYFLAAQVSEGASVADGSALPPLQVRYTSPTLTIPIRMAALSVPGEQNMVTYVILDRGPRGNRAGISSYPEFTVPDQCIWGEPGVDDFGAFYETRFRPGWEAAGRAAWAVEWAGGPYDCNPCSDVSLLPEDLAALGFVGEPDQHYLTRIHLRYTPETAQQDAIFYASGLNEPQVQSYADANASNALCIPACPDSPGEAWVAAHPSEGSDGGGGDSDGGGDDEAVDPDADPEGGDSKSCDGCGAAPRAMGLIGLLVGIFALAARRHPADLHSHA